MAKILVPHFEIIGASSYPDDVRLFTVIDDVVFQGGRYWVFNYRGDKALETGAHTYSDYEQSLRPILITITGVANAVKHSSDFLRITAYELENITVEGRVDVPDQTFSMPVRRDDGRLILFPVSVVDGAFSATLNFPTSGQYRYTNEEANIDLPSGTFETQPIKIDVLRKAIG